MKILVISHYFWPENFRINDLVCRLKEKGHDVTVLASIPNYPEGRFFKGYGLFNNRIQDYNGIRVVRVPIIPRGPGGTFRLILNYFSFTLSATVIGLIYCREKHDIIFFAYSPVTEGIPAMIIKFLKRIPIIYWVQDLWPESLAATNAINAKTALKLVDKVIKFIYKQCCFVMVQSKGFIDIIRNKGIPKERIIFFPNSAEALYRPIKRDEESDVGKSMPKGFRVMFAGNIGAAQDFNAILTAAELLKSKTDIHWVILGDGRKKRWVEKEVVKRGLTQNFHLMDRYPIEMMPEFFSFADVMLVTLKDEHIFKLTIPGKVQSYLACARPIIAALKGEGATVINEAGAGLVCEPENSQALADTVLSMYNMPVEKREIYGKSGSNYFKNNFARELLVDRLIGTMEKALQ